MPPPEIISSPTGSTVLYGGRKAQHTQKSSLSLDLDQDALTKALNSIHNAASQSQNLTVFNEYTDAPSPAPTSEDRNLVSELQGGLSGLYNKFKATVGGGRESTNTSEPSSATVASVERILSRPTSGKASRAQSQVQSPKLYASESSHTPDIVSNPSKISSQAASITKFSTSSTPAIKSPVVPPLSSVLASEVSSNGANAIGTNSTRQVLPHNTDTNDEFTDQDWKPVLTSDELASQRSLSRGDLDGKPPRLERKAVAPGLNATGADNRFMVGIHERGPSEGPVSGQAGKIGKTGPAALVVSVNGLSTNVPNGASASQPRTTSTTEHKATSNPVQLLAERKSRPQSPNEPRETLRTLERPSSPSLSANESKNKNLHVSQSRLPGFSSSRASSTDSGLTRVASSGPQQYSTWRSSIDGANDRRGGTHPSRFPDKLKSKLIDKEFWMRDENARDCFRCGEAFTTFRRKHHCRVCGQIFDNKCTTLISGSFFGQGGGVRVCKPCEVMVTSHDDDSSDYSIDDVAPSEAGTLPHTLDPFLNRPGLDEDNASVMSQPLDNVAKPPTMTLPVRKAYDDDRSSAVFEFDTEDRPLQRPTSSRSLKSSHSIGHGHKRHHSRHHQHIRGLKAYHDDRAPFQRRTNEDVTKDTRPSVFHRDSIIDPDLAQYLSDDASSGDEQSMQPVAPQDKLSRSGPDSDRLTIGGLLAAVRRGRSRIGDRSIAGFLSLGKDSDDAASIVSSRAIDGPRMDRKRNLSVASSVHHRLTPKATKERLQIITPGPDHENTSSPVLTQMRARMIRSASMHGAGAPSLELNKVSRQHAQKLLRQLLNDADIPKAKSWEDALTPILLKATDDVDPDIRGGDDIDIRNYVKLKKIPGGRPYDTSYISGLVFTKNVALKSMSRSTMDPRILVISFPLEYARQEQHFMSLDPVIRQEREYLENVVGRIAALKPDILISERNISGLALQFLDMANITTVFKVKPSVIDAVSRCTQTRVVTSLDRLGLMVNHLGGCDSFEVKTFVAGGRKKTYIYLSGCVPQLGSTVVLRGADRKVLSKIKRITDFMIYVVYNLKLETCLMRDEWALMPSHLDNTDATDKAFSKPTSTGQPVVDPRSSTSPETCDAPNDPTPDTKEDRQTSGCVVSKTDHEQKLRAPVRVNSRDATEIPDDVPVPTFYEDLVGEYHTTIVSASPFVKFSPPYVLTQARKFERQVAYLTRLREQDMTSSEISSDERGKSQRFTLLQPEMVHSPLAGTSRKVREIIRAVHDAEYDRALHNYETQKKQWESTYVSNNRKIFDPYAHQNIMVLFSQVSTSTSVPCSGPDLLAFSFYNEHENEERFEPDCTLGQFVEDLCYRANDPCPSNACEKRMYEHHRQYVHGEAQVTVFLHPYPAKMRGLQDVILMWSQCKICGVETTVTPMSSSTWKYSFGKYLELSFWGADLHARAGICPHDLHRDHLRFFGYKDFALRVQYHSIDLLEVVVPRMRITWKVDHDLRFRNGVFTRIENRITRFMVSVKLRLKSINVDALLPEIAAACRAEIETLTKKANEDHAMLIKQLQERYNNSGHWEIIPLNRALRMMQEKVADWDAAFAEFEKNYFPSEKDIRRLATLQLKKIFLDRHVSVATTGTGDEGLTTPATLELEEEKPGMETGQASGKPELSREKTQSILQAVLEEHGGHELKAEEASATAEEEKKESSLVLPEVPGGHHNTDDVRHLDLALPERRPPNTTDPDPSVDKGDDPRTPVKPSSPELESQFGPATPKASDNAVTLVSTDSTEVSADNMDERRQISRADLTEAAIRQASGRRSPILTRAQSQPATSLMTRRSVNTVPGSTLSLLTAANGFSSSSMHKPAPGTQPDIQQDPPEDKAPDRSRFATLKHKFAVKGQSFIPRPITQRKESRVSNLAKHFEQLSREFERERVRERKLRAARSRQSRVYPLAAPKPIVEVYKDVNEAVDENDEPENVFDHGADMPSVDETAEAAQSIVNTDPADTPSESLHVEDTPADTTENETEVPPSSHAPSEADDGSDDDASDEIQLPDSPEDLMRLSQVDLELRELPKHERSSLMKMLTNFWAERSSSGWSNLEYPFAASDHIFADCDIIVREDEPSSIIAFALHSGDYKSMLYDIQDHLPTTSGASNASSTGSDTTQVQADVMHSLLRQTGSHLRYQFEEGPAKMLCKIFFAEQFDAMRRKCGVADRFVESMSRCLKWDSKGGKTKSLFLKTSDDRFVLKSLSPIETQSFLKFAPNYFQIMSEAFFHDMPSVIAKMLGFYQIIMKNPVTGVEYNWFLLVMENLFYDRAPTRLFDLKGSMRNRKIHATGERNEVLLDENMVEFIYESPLFAREHSKRLLRSSVFNDTLFLARQNVMDYSLMIAIEEGRKELVVGIIDCIRTYTWDKKLESWIKDRGFAGGGKNRPTVTSPKEYKRRFREAMNRYVLEAPNCWHNFKESKSEKRYSAIETENERAEE